jgi:hypothetical protein
MKGDKHKRGNDVRLKRRPAASHDSAEESVSGSHAIHTNGCLHELQRLFASNSYHILPKTAGHAASSISVASSSSTLAGVCIEGETASFSRIAIGRLESSPLEALSYFARLPADPFFRTTSSQGPHAIGL